MKTKRKVQTILITGMLLICNTLFGQISQGGIPYSFETNLKKSDKNNIKLSKNVPIIKMPQINQVSIDSIKEQNKIGFEIFQFAYGFNVNISLKDTAVIDSMENGLLYRFSIESSGAKSINIIFKEYEVPIGAKLFLYNSNQTVIKGAYTSNNNKASNKLPIEPVAGDIITIEYFEPYYTNFKGKLVIGKISHDFIGIVNKDGSFGNSGDCNIDINCPQGNNWQNEKRAVCRILIAGSGLCTGTLINNTSFDGTPYFLTANHCIDNQSDAENSLFVFNYESPTCDGVDGSVSQSIAGADLKANRTQSDFSLLELSKTPISTFNPYYAGWDNQDIIKNNVVGIHHPSGDVKKICVENDNIQTTDYLSNTIDNTANHWRVEDWDVGVTEGGSSGSALFDNNHKVIGQLHGGYAACNGTIDNNLSDWYGKFSISWNEGSNSNNRLRDWLDPSNNTTVLNGAGICSEGTVLNLNITHTITNGSVELHQAINNIEASNIIESGATATYEAGNEIVLKPGFHAEAGSNFTAQIVPLNCVEGCYPMNLTAWTSFVCSGDNLGFNITNADNYTISVYDAGGSLVHQNSGAVSGNTVYVWNTTGVATAIYTATVSFSSECEEISNSYQLLVASCNKSAGNNNTTDSLTNALESRTINSLSETINPTFKVNVFPNPSNGSFSILLILPNPKPYSFEIINSIGETVYEMEHVNVMKVNVNQTGFPSGVYYIKLQRGNELTIKKIIIQ